MNKVAIFIDGSNIFHSAKQQGVEIDYTRLREKLLAQVNDAYLVRAFYYTGADESAEKQKSFLHWMRRNGFKVVTKPFKLDREGLKRVNLEVELTTDLLEFADKVDTVILVSGDDEYTYPLKALLHKSVRIIVAGFKNSTSNKILDLVDQWVELDSAQVCNTLKRDEDESAFSRIVTTPKKNLEDCFKIKI